jgi:hypothetical protein
LQLFFADLHSDDPLQEFTPEHLTVALSAATVTPTSPDVNSIAAAAAIATLFNCMIVPLEMYWIAAKLLLA